MMDYEKIKNHYDKEELESIYDSRKDFYKKAWVINYYGEKYLQSYDTIVAKINCDNEPFVFGWYSSTTARHINEFLKQNGFKTMSKKEMEE